MYHQIVVFKVISLITQILNSVGKTTIFYEKLTKKTTENYEHTQKIKINDMMLYVMCIRVKAVKKKYWKMKEIEDEKLN